MDRVKQERGRVDNRQKDNTPPKDGGRSFLTCCNCQWWDYVEDCCKIDSRETKATDTCHNFYEK